MDYVLAFLSVTAFVSLFIYINRRGAKKSTFRKGAMIPESRFVVAVTDEFVSCTDPSGVVKKIDWKDLVGVEIVTTDAGPIEPDVFWVLIAANEKLISPQGATGDKELLERLQQLPAFDNLKLIEAMGSTDNRTFICWTKLYPPMKLADGDV